MRSPEAKSCTRSEATEPAAEIPAEAAARNTGWSEETSSASASAEMGVSCSGQSNIKRQSRGGQRRGLKCQAVGFCALLRSALRPACGGLSLRSAFLACRACLPYWSEVRCRYRRLWSTHSGRLARCAPSLTSSTAEPLRDPLLTDPAVRAASPSPKRAKDSLHQEYEC